MQRYIKTKFKLTSSWSSFCCRELLLLKMEQKRIIEIHIITNCRNCFIGQIEAELKWSTKKYSQFFSVLLFFFKSTSDKSRVLTGIVFQLKLKNTWPCCCSVTALAFSLCVSVSFFLLSIVFSTLSLLPLCVCLFILLSIFVSVYYSITPFSVCLCLSFLYVSIIHFFVLVALLLLWIFLCAFLSLSFFYLSCFLLYISFSVYFCLFLSSIYLPFCLLLYLSFLSVFVWNLPVCASISNSIVCCQQLPVSLFSLCILLYLSHLVYTEVLSFLLFLPMCFCSIFYFFHSVLFSIS